jgi:magnesium and cobalt exporter, CNNM family
MIGETLLAWLGVVIAAAAALWSGLLALGEEAAVGDALHTLGDAPPPAGGGRVALHRALHIARLTLLVGGAVAAAHALGWWQRPTLEGLVTLLLASVLLFIVGDALPRSVARIAPELAQDALPLARRTLAPLEPLMRLFAWVDRGLHGLVATPQPLQPELGPSQREMLLGIFTLADATVDEVMTPRLDLVGVDISASTADVLAAARGREHTRLPVFDGTPDNLVGILYVKDLIPLVLGLPRAEGGGEQRWQDLVRPAAIVPETKTLDAQLRDFQRGPSHIAVVVDEFGGTAGLITLEDVLEEIVGEIRDEHGGADAPPAIQREEGGARFWVDGRVALSELSAALGGSFEHPDVSTVGGLIYSVLGRVPRPGEELTLDGFRVIVERVDRRRVTRVYFERRDAPSPAAGGST